MTLALAGSAYVADPLPGPVGLGIRLAGSLLAGYLVWISLRRAPASVPGVAISWPGAAAVAVVAFLAGWLGADALGSALAAGSGEGPGLGVAGAALASGSLVARAALGAALALAAVAAGPVLAARDALRLGLGLLLLLAAATLVRNALMGSASEVVELGLAVLTSLAGAAVGAIVGASLRITSDLVLHSPLLRETAVRHRPADDAHRRTDAAK